MDDQHVLLIAGSVRWTLPRRQPAEAFEVNRDMKARFGVVCTVRRVVHFPWSSTVEGAYVIDHRSGSLSSLPADARWVHVDEIDRFATDADCRVIRECLHQTDTKRLAWEHPQWFDEVVRWSTDELTRQKIVLHGPGLQMSHRAWSAIVRFSTSEGYVYFKATSPAFSHEPRITFLLNRWFPENIPTVIAIDDTRHWMLLRDFRTADRQRRSSRERGNRLTDALTRYAEIQLDMTRRGDQMQHLGCPDRRPHILPNLLRDLLHSGGNGTLPTEDLHTLLRYVDRGFAEACATIADAGLPSTLVNSDFWMGNISFDAEEILFYDWAESILANPLHSLVTFFQALDVSPSQNGAAREAARTYLSVWSEYGSPDQLWSWYEIAQPLGVACRALSWQQTLDHTPPRAQAKYATAVDINLGRLLQFAK
ncbi:hypothetical protein ACIGBL_33625 [Streptomyces sp. NPDC085614]|uniref:hypothetical protein n=1 Tax=Streptomyces sp. NPDC085614 TaxID=3365733 RepID=UPI0037D00BBD